MLEQTSDGLRVIDLRAFVDNLLSSLTPMLRNLRLVIGMVPATPTPVSVCCNPGRVAQVVTNLLENAGVHGYAQQGGTLEIEIASTPEHILLRVSDRGQGMSAAVAEHCMEPFFTSRRNQGGTGLGLFIVRQVVQDELGGQVNLETAEGQGTTWRLQFPLPPQAPA